MESLIELLNGLSLWHWWTLAVALLVLELMTGTTYLLWPTVAAALVGLVAASPIPFGWELQLVLFAVVTAALTLAGDKFVSKRWFFTDKPKLNLRAQQLAGEKVIATSAFVAGEGRVRLGDTVWAAELVADAPVSEGAILEVVGLEGATLQVRALAAAPAAGAGEPAAS